MLIEDRSTTTDPAPQAPRRWPKRLLVGGLVGLLVAAVAAFVVSAFALSGSSIEEDGSSLGKVSTDTFGGSVDSVQATAVKSGVAIPVAMNGDRIVPSVVQFTADGAVIVGRMAKEFAKVEPERVASVFKRGMGDRTFLADGREFEGRLWLAQWIADDLRGGQEER